MKAQKSKGSSSLVTCAKAVQPQPELNRGRKDSPGTLASRYQAIRTASWALCDGLTAEDLQPQAMEDASPGKWHLAHGTWFFEVMVLLPYAGAKAYDERFHFTFNSYYEALGARHPRPQRGLLTRPRLDEVLAWRAHVDAAMAAFLQGKLSDEAAAIVELGLQHEQQHQELFITDLKYLLAQNALEPAWRPLPVMSTDASGPSTTPAADSPGDNPACGWLEKSTEIIVEIGTPDGGFAFDNERPRHRALLAPHAIADRPVNCADYLEFIEAGGYDDPALWLADGWAARQAGGWQAPLYWLRDVDGAWSHFSIHGRRPINPLAPVAHVSYYEAHAYARFAGPRLPTEAEWEAALGSSMVDRAARLKLSTDACALREPAPPAGNFGVGEVWEWTQSAYTPYPGFREFEGPAREYNGKFMSGQMVLRGGSCATPAGHLRPGYRNFFAPHCRWQLSGLRLARDL